MSKKKKDLGQGIRALLDDMGQSKAPAAGSSVGEIAINQIEINPFQPRVDFDEKALKELSASIAVHGLVQPITVRKLPKGKFQLISGERRLRASKMAGLETVPAYVREANDQEMLEIALIENIQREDLNPMEVSLNYNRLMEECKLSQEQLGERVGKDRSTVANYLRLLKLPPTIQSALKQKKISMGHARAILGLEHADLQLHAFEQVNSKALSVRATENLVRSLAGTKKKKPSSEKKLPLAYQKLQDQLSSHFGTKVKIERKSNQKGDIVIHYFSDEDLDRILEIIDP